MLERTAGCLETGSLRRLLPASRKALKSRRTLHSAFWNHGASDLEMSPLWTSLVRMAEPLDEQRGGDEQSHRFPTAQMGMMLDFLYPAGTLRFLRQYSGWGLDRPGGKLARNGLEKLGYRQYSSSAVDTGSKEAESAAAEEPIDDHRLPAAEDGSMQMLYETLGLTRKHDYEEAWRQYCLCKGNDSSVLRKQLMRYLASSERIVDAERIIELFGTLNQEEKSPATYRNTIRSYLRLRNLADAMTLHTRALEASTIPAGSEELLAYLIQNSSWSRAFNVWKQCNRFREQVSKPISFNIFEVLDTNPAIGSQAIELAEYANRKIENASPDNPEDISELIEFVSRIVRRALLSTLGFSPTRFTSLLVILQKWKLATPTLYDDAIHMLLGLNQPKLAVRCYRTARQGNGIMFTRPMLHTILRICCDNHSILGMQQVLDDFFRIYSKPTRVAYKMCMSEFAAQGDAQTVHALFDQLCERDVKDSGKRSIVSASELAPLLHVHAKRGEVQKVVDIFNQIEDVYGLKPDLTCWNILINAYGKIHDTDRAYKYFEKLLYDDTLRPDDYTFGTMMGICTIRGDVERVVELYRFAEELKVERSAAMIDSLVLVHIKDGDLQKAESICEDALGMGLKGNRTRMWNYLLTAYAMQRDLVTVNRLLQRMTQRKVDHDQYTYSALMQALAVAKQPDRAYAILTEVMPQAGIRATSLHYAVVMGGYIATGEFDKVFRLEKRMVKRNMKGSASTKLFAMQAKVAEDERLMEKGTRQDVLNRALQMFQDAIDTMNPQDISDTARKAAGRVPLDVAYSSMIYRFAISIMGQSSAFSTVNELYAAFLKSLPEHRQSQPPLEVILSIMDAKMRERDHEAIQQCWDLALSIAKENGRPIVVPDNMPESFPTANQNQQKIIPARQLDLARQLSIYMRSLHIQMKSDDERKTVENLLKDGFKLDNHNWNLYISLLAHRHIIKPAFELCETYLMENWTGWARIRWTLPERNRLPLDLRAKRKQPRHLRPKYITLLYLARAYLELQSMAAESQASQLLLDDLEKNCPRVVKAITTMQRTDDYLERTVLRGY